MERFSADVFIDACVCAVLLLCTPFKRRPQGPTERERERQTRLRTLNEISGVFWKNAKGRKRLLCMLYDPVAHSSGLHTLD